ncbi:MAG TPA: sulfatase-like hydrolase/transferase, partial [Saprospiraceae bacterium]|nr:sulfatase-like hydrolase/transferase [Saprospiraceae bacterium]
MKQVILLFLLAVQVAAAQNRPNILWIVCEDISPTLAVYGDSTARTPHLDAHAAESLVFNAAFACAGVCAPSRSGIITGMQPTSIGTMHMRTGKDVMSWGRRTYAAGNYTTDVNGDSIREYAAVIPEEVKCFTEYLRAAGY